MAIVLPSLSQWTKNGIIAIYQASTPTANALDNFLSKDAVLTVNGSVVSRADVVNQLQVEKFAEVEATVAFLGIVEVPSSTTSRVEVI
jgi:hypothetical protein